MIVLVGERYAVQPIDYGVPKTYTFSPSANTVAGNTLILLAAAGQYNAYVTGVSDSKGNTWTVDVVNATSGRTADVCHAYLTTAILTSDTITVTVNATTPLGSLWLEEFSGLASGNSFDKSGTKTVSAGTSYTTSSTGVLSQADELAIGTAFIAETGIAGYAKDANFTNTPTQQLYRSASQYRIVSATTAITMSATWTNSVNNLASLATYKGSTTNIKTINGLAKASIKTINGLAIASVKTFNGLQ